MKKQLAVLGLALALAACTAYASSDITANPFKAVNKPTHTISIKGGPVRPAPPWTTTTNPVTNPAIYMGAPVIVEFAGNNNSAGTWQIAWISTVTTPGNAGTTPMNETVLATNAYTTIGTSSCYIFDNQADANAAITYGEQYGNYPGFSFGCIGYLNPAFL